MRIRSFINLMLAALLAGCSTLSTPITVGTPAPNEIMKEKDSDTSLVSPSPSSSVQPTEKPTPTPTTAPEVVIPDLTDVKSGVSYSFSHATWLCGGNFDCARRMLERIACGLKPDTIRLMVNWDWAQDDSPSVLKTDFNVDWQLETVSRCGVREIIMVVGVKTPHSPEFKFPRWAKGLSAEQFKAALLNYVRKIVEHYAIDTRITAWQVENEPFRVGPEYGGAYPFDVKDFYKQEIQIVREADALHRQIIGTDSGDVGDWPEIAAFVDVVGVTYYDKSCGNGVTYFDHTERNGTPLSWAERAETVKPKEVILIELKGEPWPCGSDIKNVTPDEASKTMSPGQLVVNLNFVLAAGFKKILFWGAEWWLFEKDNGRPKMWETAQKLFARK